MEKSAVDFFKEELEKELEFKAVEKFWYGLYQQSKEMEKEQKIALLKSLVYSVCIGDDVEDVEEWLKKHELNKSE